MLHKASQEYADLSAGWNKLQKMRANVHKIRKNA